MTDKGAGMGSTGGKFSVWGEYQNYSVYALCWGCFPVVLLGAYGVYISWMQYYVVDSTSRRSNFVSKVFLLSQLLYLPMGLATLRLVNCSERGYLQCDPSMQCWTSSHR
jgi:hypothetical protein